MIRAVARPLLTSLSAPHTRRNDDAHPPVSFGERQVDGRLQGGLMRAAQHEFYAATVDDGPAVCGFALMVAVRACAHAPILWIREDKGVRQSGRLYAPGVCDLGLDPDMLVIVTAPDTLGVLRAGADIVKCGQVGAVVIEPWGQAKLLDLTASRRLAMAAVASGVMTLVVRVDAQPVPSAAQTRWQVASASSTALAADAPGHPAFDITLLRHRSGIAGFDARLEWNRDARSFAPLSGGTPAAPVFGTDQARKAA